MGVLFAQDTDLDRAARQGQHNPLEGQTSLLDNPADVQEALARADAVEAAQAVPDTPAVSIAPKPRGKQIALGSKLEMFPILNEVINRGGIMPLSTAGKFAGGEYDFIRENKGMMKGMWTRAFSKQSKSGPDIVAQELVDRGLLPEGSTANDLWAALDREVSQYSSTELPEVTEGRRMRQEAKTNDQINKFNKEILAPEKLTRNHEEVYGAELQVGDKFTGEKNAEFEVIDLDPDTEEVTLQDGPRYGTVTISPEDRLFVRKWRKKSPAQKPSYSQGDDVPF